MYSSVSTAVIAGTDSIPVTCEADVSDGLPVFDMVGFLSTEARESKERVRTAVKNLGISLPAKRITINISPASIRKSGTSFDLPVAAAVLSASGAASKEQLPHLMMAGELGLSGEILGVSGILPIALCARETGRKYLIVPEENRREAALVPDLQILTADSLTELVEILNASDEELTARAERTRAKKDGGDSHAASSIDPAPDFSMIRGQRILRRAMEVAAAGKHHILLIGPPGSGKTMAARCLPTILPEMTPAEQMLLSRIYSVSGLLKKNRSLMDMRPFRAPHHTVTAAGLTGGGANPKPGEITLATSGILFLDELPEFRRDVLETLREPLESHAVTIARQGHTVTYPADFLLVCGMNPCPCGYFPDLGRCRCTDRQIANYLHRISRPLLDRIDIAVETSILTYAELSSDTPSESSSSIRARVIAARKIQAGRYRGLGFTLNSEVPPQYEKEFLHTDQEAARYLEQHYDDAGFSARSYHRLLKTARTIADLDGASEIGLMHIIEAMSYRVPDRKYWEADRMSGGRRI